MLEEWRLVFNEDLQNIQVSTSCHQNINVGKDLWLCQNNPLPSCWKGSMYINYIKRIKRETGRSNLESYWSLVSNVLQEELMFVFFSSALLCDFFYHHKSTTSKMLSVGFSEWGSGCLCFVWAGRNHIMNLLYSFT